MELKNTVLIKFSSILSKGSEKFVLYSLFHKHRVRWSYFVIIPSQQRLREVMWPLVCEWVSEWLRPFGSKWVRPSRFALRTRYRLHFLPVHFQTSHMRQGVLLILGDDVKGQGRIWHSLYKTLCAGYRLQFESNLFQTSLFELWTVGVLSKLMTSLMRKYFPKRTSGAPLHTLSKLYDAPVGFVTPPPLLRQYIAIFAVAEGWLLLDIGWFVLFLRYLVTFPSLWFSKIPGGLSREYVLRIPMRVVKGD